MVIFLLMLAGLLLLPLPLEWIALIPAQAYSVKFFINLITHMLGHSGVAHFMGNYSFVLPYALWLEKKIGPKKFLGMFVLTGFAAALGQCLSTTTSGLIGSSGAAFGIFAAACTLFGRKWYERLAALSVLSFGMASQFIMATSGWGMGVAYWAHFYGGVGGILLALAWRSQSSQSKSSPPRK